MKRVKLIIYILVICFLSFLFTACDNYSELNNVMIVDGIGIDKKKDEYVVSFNTYITDDKYEIHTISNNSLETIFNDIYLEVNKKIYLSHLNVLVLSSNLENEDIINIINTFNKHNDLRGSFNVVLADDYNPNIFSKTSAKIIETLKNNYLELGTVYPTTFNDLINDKLEMDIAYIPVLDCSQLKIIGTHSLFSEYRFYDTDESMILNLLLNKTNNISFEIDKEKVKINDMHLKYQVNNNNLTFIFNMIITSNINKNKIAQELENNINSFLNNDISYNCFKKIIKTKDYEFYKNNDDFTINFLTEINITKENMNNMKDGDIIEKNSKH